MFGELYNRLYNYYGDLKWWPADTPDETVIGCILTQNTAWSNVEKSIHELKNSDVITLSAIKNIDIERLKLLIRSSGFYNQKGVYLKNVADTVIKNFGSLENMRDRDRKTVENLIINIKGVGNETMESIMLYALDYNVFVVDAYTFRFFNRYYGRHFTRNEIRDTAEKEFKNIETLKNFHGMIVYLSKDICKKKPLCSACFLKEHCITGRELNL